MSTFSTSKLARPCSQLSNPSLDLAESTTKLLLNACILLQRWHAQAPRFRVVMFLQTKPGSYIRSFVLPTHGCSRRPEVGCSLQNSASCIKNIELKPLDRG
jgi:hypothetical protein